MPTLTSTGNVNLTSSTNWSPAQVPANGDILVMGGHTLTLDADISLAELRLNNVSTRLAYSGGPRTITITTDLQIGAVLSATAITLTAGQELTIQFGPGALGYRGVAGTPTQPTFTVNGGTLRLLADTTDDHLLSASSAVVMRVFSSVNAASVIETRGRPTVSNASLGHILFNLTAGNWTHTHTGQGTHNSSNGSSRLITTSGSGTLVINWTGDISTTCIAAANAGLIDLANTASTVTLNGKFFASVSLTGSLLRVGSGIVTINGIFCHSAGTNSLTILVSAGTLNWASQSATIDATETVTILASGGNVNLSGLLLDNYNKFVGLIYGTASGSSTGTVITNQPGAYAAVNLINPIIITTPDPAPTLPPTNKVQAGEVYGYSASLLTGNGPIIDSSVLASAIASAIVDKPTLAQIEASAILAKEATVANRPTLAQIEASAILAKEATVATRASTADVINNANPRAF